MMRCLPAGWIPPLAKMAPLRLFYEVVVPQEYRTYDKLVQMDLAVEHVESRDMELNAVTPHTRGSEASCLAAIRERGSLRVGYLKDALPFVYHNKKGDIIGLDADMAHLLKLPRPGP
jgi:ABC-type amino acid transport substrate-binding protein